MPHDPFSSRHELESTRRMGAARGRARHLARRYGGLDGVALLRPLIAHEFPGRIAAVSSFGAESAVLLHLIARIDPTVPVIFLNTGQHFSETLAYRDELSACLGLADVRIAAPDPRLIARRDPAGSLWQSCPDLCCQVRKVEPLHRALAGFDAWITGRKRFHGGARGDLPCIEAVDGYVKINPLAAWRPAQIAAVFAAACLPPHPLAAADCPSIGCAPCTRRVPAHAPARAGRWADLAKTECGIHWPAPARG